MKNVISCFSSLENNLRSHNFSSNMTPNIYPALFWECFSFSGSPCHGKSRNPRAVTQSKGDSSDDCSLLLKGHCCSCSTPSGYWVRQVVVSANTFQTDQTTGSSLSPPSMDRLHDPSKTITIINIIFPKVPLITF